MKKKLFGFVGAILAVGACALAFANVNQNKSVLAKALGSFSIEDDQYEAAFLEQYNSEPNAAPNDLSKAVEDYSYANDKPLGKSAVGGYQYGIGGPKAVNLKKSKFETNLFGVNETLTWKFSYMHVLSKNNPNRLYVQIENNSSDKNICSATSFPSADYPDEYAVGQLISGQGYAKGAVMYTSSTIKNIQDFTFYWRSSYAQKVYIVYKIDGGSWKIFGDSGEPNGNYSGTRGWDTYGYTSFNYASWATSELKGANAQIGIACTEAPTESGSLPISAILINSNNAAVRYLNTISYKNGACSDSLYDLRKTSADNRHNQDYFHLVTEHAEASFLANYEVGGTETTETNILSFYNYLVSAVPGLGTAKSASAISFSNGIVSFADGNVIAVVIAISIAAALSVSVLLIAKKKKQ